MKLKAKLKAKAKWLPSGLGIKVLMLVEKRGY